MLKFFSDLFDLNVKSCRASSVPLVTDRCPDDEELFPTLNKTSFGCLETDFNMFRPTTMTSGPVSLYFSCQLEVCYSPCTWVSWIVFQ